LGQNCNTHKCIVLAWKLERKLCWFTSHLQRIVSKKQLIRRLRFYRWNCYIFDNILYLYQRRIVVVILIFILYLIVFNSWSPFLNFSLLIIKQTPGEEGKTGSVEISTTKFKTGFCRHFHLDSYAWKRCQMWLSFSVRWQKRCQNSPHDM
jgi:hypothetical protein